MNYPRASIALISLLIISAFTLILVTEMGISSISSYRHRFQTESSEVSHYAAEACLEETLLRLERESDFLASEFILDSDTSCSISVSGSFPWTITLILNYLDTIQTFQAKVELTQSGEVFNAELLSWEEVR